MHPPAHTPRQDPIQGHTPQTSTTGQPRKHRNQHAQNGHAKTSNANPSQDGGTSPESHPGRWGAGHSSDASANKTTKPQTPIPSALKSHPHPQRAPSAAPPRSNRSLAQPRRPHPRFRQIRLHNKQPAHTHTHTQNGQAARSPSGSALRRPGPFRAAVSSTRAYHPILSVCMSLFLTLRRFLPLALGAWQETSNATCLAAPPRVQTCMYVCRGGLHFLGGLAACDIMYDGSSEIGGFGSECWIGGFVNCIRCERERWEGFLFVGEESK
jgi:hypothetical protein